MYLAARNGCKNRQLVAVLNRLAAARVLLINGEQQRMLFELRKSPDNLPESFGSFRPFSQIKFDFSFAGRLRRRAEK